MTEASIPVDLLNPGQVFASLGFLEAAEALFGRAEGGFDWADTGSVRFVLTADCEGNPFERVLEFLSCAEVRRVAPPDYVDARPKKKSEKLDDDVSEETSGDMDRSDCFPAGEPEGTALPVRLIGLRRYLNVTHWADGSSRDSFKLYAGNRSAALIARAMLTGTREKSRKGKAGILKTKGIQTLWAERRAALLERPFDVLTPMGGSFNFDARGGWTALDAGYSPNDQRHGVAASPVVEMLAAVGLENARPELRGRSEGRRVRYAAWGERLGPLLARPSLAGCRFGVPLRVFEFKLALSGKNKVVNFAEGEC